MDPILYTSANGGGANFGRQTVIANNLANANTTGFKSDIYEAQTMYVKSAGGANTYGQAFTTQNPNNVDFSAGAIVNTNRNLDVAVVNSNGWLAVQDTGGKEAYTKAGAFAINANGMLVTPSGKPVIGGGGPISVPPADSIIIGTDGTISIVPQGADPSATTVIDRLKLVTLDNTAITKNTDGLFQLKSGSVAPADNNVTVVSGALEGSNVSPVDQMVSMITSGRDFEINMNLMSTLNENLSKLSQVIHE